MTQMPMTFTDENTFEYLMPEQLELVSGGRAADNLAAAVGLLLRRCFGRKNERNCVSNAWRSYQDWLKDGSEVLAEIPPIT